MTIFINKQDYNTDPVVFAMLTALEKAHKNDDEFSASILLTRLKKEHGLEISTENACTLN